MNRLSPPMDMEWLKEDASVETARKILRERDDEVVTDLLELVQIPAPSLEEGTRAEALMERFVKAGLEEPRLDEVGNVLVELPGGSRTESGSRTTAAGSTADGSTANGLEPILLAAHLDTVFPIETDLTPRHEGKRYYAPGIGDNTRGLVALLALARAIVGSGIETVRPVTLIGTVGEEGIGDLHGVKHLFREGSPWRDAAAFIAVDGTGLRRIVNQAIGSRRLRVVVHGPGGHSWADWGLANPVNAVGLAIAKLSAIDVPALPRSTLTVGRVGGGTSVNTIPAGAWMELDIRSEEGDSLATLEQLARTAIESAVLEAGRHRRSGTDPLEVEIEVIGDRPAGTTPPDSPLVAVARAATRAIGEVPELVGSSTDANVPISLGIPAITLGAGGRSGGAHTIGEWYENEGGSAGLERLLLTLLAIAGVG